MVRYEYLRLKMSNIPDDVIAKYNLQGKETKDGCVYVEVQKEMYGLLISRNHNTRTTLEKVRQAQLQEN